jgi:hypothetical protein
MCDRDSHPLNAPSPMLTNESGNTIRLINLQPEKASFLIIEIEEGIINLSILVQSLNASLPIETMLLSK